MTDKEISSIINDIVVIVDTREVKNQHILDYLIKNNIPYIVEKLDTADYSFILPNNRELGLDKKVLIEKKNSLDEIAGNFTSGRERFAREFERIEDEHFHLVIENATFKKIMNGNTRSKISPKSLLASILVWTIRYDIKTWFVTKEESPYIIYSLLKYELMEILKNKC